MANSKISRSWTFFGGNSNINQTVCLHEDFQPNYQSSTNARVDLQQRFNQNDGFNYNRGQSDFTLNE